MKLRVTVHGVSYEVDVEILDDDGLMATPTPVQRIATPVVQSSSSQAEVSKPQSDSNGNNSNGITAPIAGTVKELKIKVGDSIKKDQVAIIIEAMKMNTEISSQKDGKVKKINISVGDSVRDGQLLVEFE